MVNKLLNAPIPGMSLTVEPGSRPWEQPPKYSNLSDVVQYYADKISEPKIIDSILGVLKQDFPAYELAKGLTAHEAMVGIHSVDVANLVTPVVVELIITLAELNDVGYVMTAEDKKQMGKVDEDLIKEALSEVKDAATEKISSEGGVKKAGLMAKGEK